MAERTARNGISWRRRHAAPGALSPGRQPAACPAENICVDRRLNLPHAPSKMPRVPRFGTRGILGWGAAHSMRPLACN